MRRRQIGGTAYQDYLAELRRFETIMAAFLDLDDPDRVVARMERGEPVIVAHGWEIDLDDPNSGPILLTADGVITPVEPVYRDVDTERQTIVNYRLPDGQLLWAETRGKANHV